MVKLNLINVYGLRCNDSDTMLCLVCLALFCWIRKFLSIYIKILNRIICVIRLKYAFITFKIYFLTSGFVSRFYISYNIAVVSLLKGVICIKMTSHLWNPNINIAKERNYRHICCKTNDVTSMKRTIVIPLPSQTTIKLSILLCKPRQYGAS